MKMFFCMSKIINYRSDKTLKTSVVKMFGRYLSLISWFTSGGLPATLFLPSFLLPFAPLLALSLAATSFYSQLLMGGYINQRVREVNR